jgi:hypothetical protein
MKAGGGRGARRSDVITLSVMAGLDPAIQAQSLPTERWMKQRGDFEEGNLDGRVKPGHDAIPRERDPL